jgi:hypothetical protein
MHAPRTRAACTGLAVTAAVLAGNLSPAPAAPSASSGTAVKFRLSQDLKTNTSPVWGTYTVSGGIRDRGTLRGSITPVYKKVHGDVQVVAIDAVQTEHGKRGSVVIKCRDSHFILAKDGHVVRASGPCVIGAATGVYMSLAPLASTIVLPTHPRKGYTHVLRLVMARTRAA